MLRGVLLGVLCACSASGCTGGLSPSPAARQQWHDSSTKNTSFIPRQSTPVTVPPKQRYSLAESLDQALSTNPNTRVAWFQAQAAAAVRLGAASPFYPEIAGVASYGRSRSQFAQADITREFTSSAPRINLSYLIFDFGERFASLRAAEEGLRSANFQHNRAIEQVVFETQRRFFLFDASQAAVVAARQTIEEAKRSYEAAQKGFAIGSRPKQDELQAEAVLRRAEFDLENNIALTEEARAAFAEALGVPVIASLAIESPDYTALEGRSAGGEVTQLLEQSLRARPDLQAVYADARAASARRDVAERADLPKIVGTMSGGKNFLYAGESGIEENYTVGVEVQVPIFTGYRNAARIRQEEALAKGAMEQSHAKELSVAREVWSAFFRFEAAQRQTRAAHALHRSAEESYKAVQTGYANGANSVLDLLAAQRDLSDARRSLITAQANCGVAFAELSFVTGALDAEATNMQQH